MASTLKERLLPLVPDWLKTYASNLLFTLHLANMSVDRKPMSSSDLGHDKTPHSWRLAAALGLATIAFGTAYYLKDKLGNLFKIGDIGGGTGPRHSDVLPTAMPTAELTATPAPTETWISPTKTLTEVPPTATPEMSVESMREINTGFVDGSGKNLPPDFIKVTKFNQFQGGSIDFAWVMFRVKDNTIQSGQLVVDYDKDGKPVTETRDYIEAERTFVRNGKVITVPVRVFMGPYAYESNEIICFQANGRDIFSMPDYDHDFEIYDEKDNEQKVVGNLLTPGQYFLLEMATTGNKDLPNRKSYAGTAIGYFDKLGTAHASDYMTMYPNSKAPVPTAMDVYTERNSVIVAEQK